MQLKMSALVLIDLQLGAFTHKRPLYMGDEVLQRVAALLKRARASHVPISHVQHDVGTGHVLAKGSPGWPHHPVVAPQPGETVIEKRYSSAFHDTDFHGRLTRSGIDRLVIAGIQTEMCVDSACRAAVTLGYHVMLVSDGHTTWDSPTLPAERIIAHHNYTLGNGFADLFTSTNVQC
jgi:nicotinamidase-related amidase